MEQSTWQAVPAMCFAERSGFGLNALLGRVATSMPSTDDLSDGGANYAAPETTDAQTLTTK